MDLSNYYIHAPQAPNNVRGNVEYVYDPKITGDGYTGRFRPVVPDDFGSIITTSGIQITGIFDTEQLVQIAGSGSPISGMNKVFVDTFGRMLVLSVPTGIQDVAQAGSWGVEITGQPINVTGNINVTLMDGGKVEVTGQTVSSLSTLDDVIITGSGIAMQVSSGVSLRGVMITANPENSGSLFIGDSTVTASAGSKQGIVLIPGGMTPVPIPVSNPNQIYINGDYSGDRAGILAI